MRLQRLLRSLCHKTRFSRAHYLSRARAACCYTSALRRTHSSTLAIDLRSDVRATPTPRMIEAMAETSKCMADDVFGECEVTNSLERRVSELCGFHAGLFVPSGTMANLIATVVHCDGIGSEMIVGWDSHLHYYEQGASAVLGRVHNRALREEKDGTLDLERIRKAIRVEDVHFPVTRMIALENTHNRCGGTVLPLDYLPKVRALADEHSASHGLEKIKIHMDGARFWNAHEYWREKSGGSVSMGDLTNGADSMMVCFSKSMATPIGSVLMGSQPFIASARRLRKALGGGMRNAAIVAQCAHVSLDEFLLEETSQIESDHRNARLLADGIADMRVDGLRVSTAHTNMFFLKTYSDFPMSDSAFVARCHANGVLVLNFSPNVFRLVVYHQINEETVREALKRFANVFS